MIAKKALIVDDSRTACAVLARMLKPYGIESDSVYSAEEALEFLQEGHKPDLIFMDHTMPGMDGLETVKLIKENPNTAMIPVMMYTARSGEVYMGQARALGAIDVLPKELKPTMVEQALRKLGVLKSQGEVLAVQPVYQAVSKSAEITTEVISTATATSDLSLVKEESIEEYVHTELHKLKEDLAYAVANSMTELQNDYIRQTRRLLKQYTAQYEEKAEVNSKALLRDFHQYSDFKESLFMRENRNKHWTLTGALVLTVGFVGWLFIDSDDLSLQLEDMGAQTTATFSLVQHMEGRMQDLEGVVEKLRDDVTASGSSGPSSFNNRGQISRLPQSGSGGTPAGRLLGYSEDGRLANFLTESEYLMQLDVKGQLATRVPVRYFLGSGCYGESYVEAHDGVVFIASDRSIWYTPRKSELAEVLPRYQMNQAGDCALYQGVAVSLRTLASNDPKVTKVDKIRYDISR